MELELLRYIQSAASPVLDVFFIGITMLAEPALWVVVLAWIYWNSDKTAGTVHLLCDVHFAVLLQRAQGDLPDAPSHRRA